VGGSLEGSGVFLTAGFQPPYEGQSLAKQIEVSSQTQRFATGGSIQHIFLNEKAGAEVLAKFVRSCSKNPPLY